MRNIEKEKALRRQKNQLLQSRSNGASDNVPLYPRRDLKELRYDGSLFHIPLLLSVSSFQKAGKERYQQQKTLTDVKNSYAIILKDAYFYVFYTM